jgi:hypothetical protein
MGNVAQTVEHLPALQVQTPVPPKKQKKRKKHDFSNRKLMISFIVKRLIRCPAISPALSRKDLDE